MTPDDIWVGSLVLDSQGFSKLLDGDEAVTKLFIDAGQHQVKRVASALTLVEAHHPRVNLARLDYLLSCMDVIDATKVIAGTAIRLLHEASKHGHKDAIDAIVAATALAQPPPVLMLTSDPHDMQRLCGDRVRITEV